MVDWERVGKLMKNKVIVDGRNLYNRSEVESYGFDYMSIGR